MADRDVRYLYTKNFYSYINSTIGADFTAAKASYAFAVCKNYPVLFNRMMTDCIGRADLYTLKASGALLMNKIRPSFKFTKRLNSLHDELEGDI